VSFPVSNCIRTAWPERERKIVTTSDRPITNVSRVIVTVRSSNRRVKLEYSTGRRGQNASYSAPDIEVNTGTIRKWLNSKSMGNGISWLVLLDILVSDKALVNIGSDRSSTDFTSFNVFLGGDGSIAKVTMDRIIGVTSYSITSKSRGKGNFSYNKV